jgi:hypothetical protein
MTAAHFIYIPIVILIGVGLGFVLGARATRDVYESNRRVEEARRSRASNDDLNRPET